MEMIIYVKRNVIDQNKYPYQHEIFQKEIVRHEISLDLDFHVEVFVNSSETARNYFPL
jgi:hypothetical protein